MMNLLTSREEQIFETNQSGDEDDGDDQATEGRGALSESDGETMSILLVCVTLLILALNILYVVRALHSAGFEHDSSGVITGDSLSADEAFQVFNGRLYHTSKRSGGLTYNNNSNSSSSSAIDSLSQRVDEREYFSMSAALERRSALESPLERFNRLRMELSDLQSDVDIMEEQEKVSNSSSSQQKKGDHPSLWAVLQKEVLALAQQAVPLQTRIDAVESARRTSMTADSSPPTADQQLDDLRKSISLLSGPPPSPPSGSSDEANQSLAPPGTDYHHHSKQAYSHSQMGQLERRIHHLESCLGSMSNLTAVSSFHSHSLSSHSHGRCLVPIIDVIARLEDKLSLLDPKEMDATRVALDGLRVDLEHTTTTTAMTAKESRLVEAYRGLAGLVQLVDKVDAAADDLPVLVTRLKTLEQVHVAATTFNTR